MLLFSVFLFSFLLFYFFMRSFLSTMLDNSFFFFWSRIILILVAYRLLLPYCWSQTIFKKNWHLYILKFIRIVTLNFNFFYHFAPPINFFWHILLFINIFKGKSVHSFIILFFNKMYFLNFFIKPIFQILLLLKKCIFKKKFYLIFF